MRSWTRWAGAVLLVVAGAGISGTSAANAKPARTGEVYVIQAVSNATVAVSIDGRSQGKSLAAKAILGPLHLSAGRHALTLTPAAGNWSVRTSIRVVAGKSRDVVLHRPAAVKGDPLVTTYRNPLRPVSAGQGRVMVAHTAVVPPADIHVDGSVLFSNVANGEFATADVPSGTHQVAILATGTRGDPLLGPVGLDIAARTLTQVFAIGRPSNGSMDVIVQQLPLATAGSAPPTIINTGSAGLVAAVPVSEPGGPPAVAIWLSAVLAAGGAMLLARRPRGRHVRSA